MTILVKQARIMSADSPYHGQVKDILISNGIITEISDLYKGQTDLVIEQPGLHVSAGWMDMFAHFCDPGQEQKETLETGAVAAATGGFTDVCLIPNTQPVISGKSQVEYITHKSAGLPVTLHPIGSATRNAEGKELSEMYDMSESGAIAFSDGIQPIQSAGMLSKALQYLKRINGTLIQVPDDRSLSASGLMNEGIISTRLGLPGKPSIAEELMIARDIELLRYTGSNLHITGISTRKGMNLIRDAKKEGLRVTVSVTPYHLAFCDEDLQEYDTNLKVNPPLRTRDDMMAVREAVNDGTVDAIASHHIPQHWDDKTCEFEYARHGMASIESLFGAVRPYVQDISKLIHLLTVGPRMVLHLTPPQIREGLSASLSLFLPDEQYTLAETMIRSRSRNNAFIGKTLTGRVVGIIHKNQIHLNQS